MTETEAELAALARVWDKRGLLYVRNFDIPGYFPEEQVRIFGCFKNSCRDRQIGDKRGRNYAEDKASGPSKHLPAAADLCDLRLNLQQEKVTLSITDRRDFYHQIRISEEKALTNSLGPGLDPSLLTGTDAMNLFLMKPAWFWWLPGSCTSLEGVYRFQLSTARRPCRGRGGMRFAPAVIAERRPFGL